MKIVVTGGGTGGHLIPALAVALELRSMGCKVYFIGSELGPEKELVEAEKFEFYGIQTGKLRRYFSISNLIDLGRVIVGFLQSYKLLLKIKPQAIFAKGGYVSLPVVYAAAFLEIPIVAHESDVVMGLANKLTLAKANLICTGFPLEYYDKSNRPKLRFTGNPIRPFFYKNSANKKAIMAKLKFVASRPILLVVGGSQGAHEINNLIFEQLAILLSATQIIHLTGEKDLKIAQELKKQLTKKLSDRYLPFGFMKDEIVDFMRCADLVVTRSGANILSELATLRKPALIIPLPNSASDHQLQNALVLKKQSAAIVLEQANLNSVELASRIIGILADHNQLNSLSRSIGFFSSPKAASIIAEIVIEAGLNLQR